MDGMDTLPVTLLVSVANPYFCQRHLCEAFLSPSLTGSSYSLPSHTPWSSLSSTILVTERTMGRISSFWVPGPEEKSSG